MAKIKEEEGKIKPKDSNRDFRWTQCARHVGGGWQHCSRVRCTLYTPRRLFCFWICCFYYVHSFFLLTLFIRRLINGFVLLSDLAEGNDIEIPSRSSFGTPCRFPSLFFAFVFLSFSRLQDVINDNDDDEIQEKRNATRARTKKIGRGFFFLYFCPEDNYNNSYRCRKKNLILIFVCACSRETDIF